MVEQSVRVLTVVAYNRQHGWVYVKIRNDYLKREEEKADENSPQREKDTEQLHAPSFQVICFITENLIPHE